MKKTLLTFLTSLLAFSSIAYDRSGYSFIHITGEDGLSQSNVKAILKDSYGFMWFGTKNGLNRYDGTSLVLFDCDDPVARRGNHNISALYEDSCRQIWVGTDRGVYRYDPLRDTFTFLDLRTSGGAGMDNWVSSIADDPAGNIWVVIPDQGVFRCRDMQLYFYEMIGRSNFKSDTPDCICVTEKGEVWIGTWGAGLFRYDPAADRFVPFRTDKDGRSLASLNINSICENSEGWLVLAVQEGRMLKYHPERRILQEPEKLDLSHTFVRNVIRRGDEIWAGTHDGVYIIREKTGEVLHLQSVREEPLGLSDNIIYTMYRDDTGAMWLGTMFGGVNYLPERELVFEKYVAGNSAASLSSARVRELAEDESGNIWVGTEDGGINVLAPRTGTVRRISTGRKAAKKPEGILSLSAHGGRIYSGLFKRGLNEIRPDGSRRHYDYPELNIEEGSVYAFYIDRSGRKWIGTGSGLFVAPKGSFVFSRVEETGYDWIFDILETGDGTFWFTSMGSGVWKHDAKNNTFEKYFHREDEPNSLSSNSVSSAMQDSRGRVWFSTDRGGICRYRPETNDFVTYSLREGLPDDVAYKILEDSAQNLWFGTNKGLVRFHPDRGEIQVFTVNDGLPGNQFNYKSAVKANDGKFYFGGIDGLVAFHPVSSRAVLAPAPPLYISKLRIYNEEITVHTPGSPLKESIIGTKKINLPYNRTNLSFDLALLSYANTRSNRYYYRLDPLDKNWIRAAGNRNISYAQLAPGNYTFRIKADNAAVKPATGALAITVLPPWWRSAGAYSAYISGGCLCLLGGFLWYRRRKEQQWAARQKLFEIEKEKELYESKVAFFTEVAHEIRTPLTLINGPLEIIREMHFDHAALNRNLDAIARNTHRLLQLTTQLLDFQKLGSHKMKLVFTRLDVAALLQETAGRFEPTMAHEHKKLALRLPDSPVFVPADREALTKIVSNLLNNALKYARQEIVLELQSEAEQIVVCVTSDGEKIPADRSEQLFEPFYRLNCTGAGHDRHGIGIGLPLARSLAQLHGGRLCLDPERPGNAFVLTLPLGNNVQGEQETVPSGNEVPGMPEKPAIQASGDMPRYTLLLAEDNEEMLDFLLGRLSEIFTVRVARNGREALDVLKNNPVDLVVSDVMMPVMNGWELGHALKDDPEWCHIPLIFLTAKNDLESKIGGLKIGAEAYVEKPFSFDYLKMQILSLLENRRKEREAFARRPFLPMNNLHLNQADEAFMERAIDLVNENLTDESFNVERLADLLCMSRSGLLRKIKTLFNLSPVDFIRLIRLKKAAELIGTGCYRLAEVGERVGIHSPSYFGKLFFKQFGMTPKDFEKQCRSKQEPVDMAKRLDGK